MVFPEIKVVPRYPPMSNQTPVGPANPQPIAYQVKQQIKTWLPHTTPNLDNNYQGIPQKIKTKIPTNLPEGVYPGTYGFIIENRIPGGVKQIGATPKIKIVPNVGRINPPAGYTVSPGNVKQIGYQGIPQNIKTAIPTNLPEGVYPGTYSIEKMSYTFDSSSFLVGGFLGFLFGGIIFTAAGKSLARAAAARTAHYIAPKVS